jgi:hypothetical protein
LKKGKRRAAGRKPLGFRLFVSSETRRKKNERGMKKAGASSQIQRKQTREVQKLKRATASPWFEI